MAIAPVARANAASLTRSWWPSVSTPYLFTTKPVHIAQATTPTPAVSSRDKPQLASPATQDCEELGLHASQMEHATDEEHCDDQTVRDSEADAWLSHHEGAVCVGTPSSKGRCGPLLPVLTGP